jgi:hypothetical protein
MIFDELFLEEMTQSKKRCRHYFLFEYLELHLCFVCCCCSLNKWKKLTDFPSAADPFYMPCNAATSQILVEKREKKIPNSDALGLQDNNITSLRRNSNFGRENV